MSAITKERIKLFIKNPLDNGLTRGEQMELARIALASLTAKPIAWTDEMELTDMMIHGHARLFKSLHRMGNPDLTSVVRLYRNPVVDADFGEFLEQNGRVKK